MWNSIVSVPDHCSFFLLFISVVLVARLDPSADKANSERVQTQPASQH